MAYKKGSGCQPITAKLKYTTKGGVVDPLLNLGSPAKMKMHSPAKLTPSERRAQSNKVRAQYKKAEEAAQLKAKAIRQNELDKSKPLSEYLPTTRKAVEKRMKLFDAKYGNKTSAPKTNKKTTTKSSGGSMTPTSVKNGKGVIHGPKVSYDMAYKNRDMKTYGKMSKSEYIAEAKRQTKSFKDTGKWNATKPRKKQTLVVVTPETKTVSIETKKPTATVDVKVTKTAKPTKTQARKTKAIDKKLAKAKVAREAGDIKKAERKEKRAARKQARINKRAAKKNSPAAKKGCYSK